MTFNKPKIVTEAWKHKVRRYERLLRGYKDKADAWHPGLLTGVRDPVVRKVKNKAAANKALYGKPLSRLKLRGVIVEKGTAITSKGKGVEIKAKTLEGFAFRFHEIKASEYLDVPEDQRIPFEAWIESRIQDIVDSRPKSSRWIIGAGRNEINAQFDAGSVVTEYKKLAVRYGKGDPGVGPGEELDESFRGGPMPGESQHPTNWMLILKEIIPGKASPEQIARYQEARYKRKGKRKNKKRPDGRVDKSQA